jgi:hypothetical protein
MSHLSSNDGEKRDLPDVGVGVSHPLGGSWLIDLSRYVFETLREDGEFVVSRGRSDDGKLGTILLVAPVSEHPVPESWSGLSTNMTFGMSSIQTGRLDPSPLFVVEV